jgi:hypothetical protein
VYGFIAEIAVAAVSAQTSTTASKRFPSIMFSSLRIVCIAGAYCSPTASQRG